MRITTKGRYALRAILNLASASQDRPVSIKQIAQEEAISPEFLEQIFFKLKKAEIIRSVRGPGGGFMLNRSADEITVKALFDAVGEGLDLTPCMSCDTDPCEKARYCVAHKVWADVTEKVVSYFEALTLRQIIKTYTNVVADPAGRSSAV